MTTAARTPQLSIRSAKARALAQSLARRTGLPMNRLVEQALERLDSELRSGANAHPLDAVWAIAAEGRRGETGRDFRPRRVSVPVRRADAPGARTRRARRRPTHRSARPARGASDRR